MDTRSDFSWPAAAPSQPERGASPEFRAVRPAAPDFAPRPALSLPGLKDDVRAAIELVPLELVNAAPRADRPAIHFQESGRTPPAPTFDAGSGSALPPDAAGVAGVAGSASGGPAFSASHSASPDETNLLAMMNFIPQGGSGGGAGAPQAAPTGASSGGGSGPETARRPPHGRGRDSTDPLWVLDANSGLYLADGGTIHDFSTWTVDLYAQVAGATVAANGYTWNLSNAPDASTASGQGAYHLHFQWNNFTETQNQPHADTITLQTTNTDHSGEFQTFNFAVYGTNDAAWSPNSSRPTPPTFPLLVPPDAVQSDQETIAAQYYSLGEATGEVMTHFTLPAYNPNVPALQLDYSSLAANPQPIFTEYYQLDPNRPSVPSTVTASLYWNCTAGNCTSTNLVASAVYDTGGVQNASNTLNPGDIMDIALQYVPSSAVATGRYPYEIDVNAGGTVTKENSYVGIVNSAGSPFGAGWTLDNLEHVWAAADGSGVTLELPGGQSLWYRSLGNGYYQSPPGDTSVLSGGGAYERVLKDGTQIWFYGGNDGYESQIIDAIENRTLTINYDPTKTSQIDSITDYLGNVVTLTYNAAGKVSGFQDPAGRTTQLGYDATNTQLTSITDPNPSIPGFTEATPVMTYGYNSANQLTTLIDPDGSTHTTTVAYSSLSNRVSTVTRADGTTESLTPQQMSGLVASGTETTTLAVQAGADYTDPRGKDWFDTLDWSGFGRGTESFDPLGDETIVHRDSNGFPWVYEDPLDNATRTFFDQGSTQVQGNPTEIVLPDGNHEQYTYDGDSQPLTHVDPNGNATTISYGQNPAATSCSCPVKVILPPVSSGPVINPTVLMTYTLDGRLLSQADPNGNVFTLGYDGSQDRLTSITTRSDAGTDVTKTLAYNSAGDLIWSEDELMHVTTFTVDNLGRVLVEALPTGGFITATYDAAGNQKSLTDPLSSTDTTTFGYDAMNRVAWEQHPNGGTTTYGYYEDGQIKDIFDRDTLSDGYHRDRHFIYDDAGRLLTEQWLDNGVSSYTATFGYDAASELTSAQDNNSAYAFGYDARGRQISADNANTLNIPHVVLTSVYDADSNRTQLTDSLNGAITYGYDAENLLTNLSMSVSGATDHPVMTLGYDLGGRLTSISRTMASGGNQVNTALTYTARDQVKSITHTSSTGSVTLAAYTYGYDPAENLLNYAGPEGNLTYSYDTLNQLTGVAASTMAYNESYSYAGPQGQDLNGNRSSASFGGTNQTYGTPAAGNRLTTDGQYTYAYDNEGNLTSKWGLESGVLTTYAYSWDFRNRMIAASVNRGGTITTENFTYDVFDRRIGVMVVGSSVTQWSVYDGQNVYADFSNSTLTTRYLYGNGLDELYARTNGSGNSTAWYLTDHLGSVRLIVDAGGHTLYSVNYFSFGGIVPGSESGTGGDRFKFAGREWDGIVGLYYNRARYYDPNTGRFASEDPMGFPGGDVNFYRYVDDNPERWLDPSGLLMALPPPRKAPSYNEDSMNLVNTPGTPRNIINRWINRCTSRVPWLMLQILRDLDVLNRLYSQSKDKNDKKDIQNRLNNKLYDLKQLEKLDKGIRDLRRNILLKIPPVSVGGHKF